MAIEQSANPGSGSSARLNGNLLRGWNAAFAREKRLAYGLYGISSAREAGKYSIITPCDPERRGAQLSIRLTTGRGLCDRLLAEGVIGDWREPDTYRVAAVPLYNSFRDVCRFVQHFSAALS